MTIRAKVIMLAGAALLALSGCQTLRRLGLNVEPPEASISEVSLSRLTFSDAALDVQILVDNPNPVSVTLTGYSWRLEVEGVEFLTGDHDQALTIAAIDESTVEVPVSLTWAAVADTVATARGLDELRYTIETELRFEVPILGNLALPLRHEGTLPVPRLPVVTVAELALESISITGATLGLALEIENPNSFAITVESVDYAFAVQDRVWMEGATTRPRTLVPDAVARVDTRFSLNFAAFGRTVRDLLLGDREIEYLLSAALEIDPDLEPIPPLVMSVDREGAIDLRR